jgi:uncharacterized protein (TIGR02145 family)
MDSNKNLTPLTSNNNATYKVVDGVTYFKLKSEFDGDYTKHCGLLGEEIDENFYFLRGYDIDSIFVDENRNLIINRVDKDHAPLVVNIGEELGQPKFDFNKNTGTITVTYPDGTTSKMEGFLIEGQDIRIATDSSLNGNGTIFNPLRLAPVERTGTLAPANEYYDLTIGNEFNKMPNGKGKGYRVVTKEKIDNFGCLYSYDAVEAIQKDLIDSGSQWRIPSKADWDELLNALECPEDRNHSASTCNWLGRFAGSGLKSANMWKEFRNLPTEDSVIGQDVRGITIYPVGITPDRNAILNDSNHDAEGFTQIAGMWTSTKNSEGNAYVKIFGFNSAKVDQDTYGDGARMSIRLVKEYSYSNYEEIETILGLPYPTELVYGIHDDYTYAKVWTKINLYDADKYNGIRSEEWSAVTDSERGVKIVYFINEWDGTRWSKKPLSNGESVVILDRDGLSYHEWRIIDGELIDTADALVTEFNKDFSEVKEDIAELSATTKELINFSGSVVATINEFSAATEEHINNITENISSFSAATVAEVNRIDETVNAFSAATVAEVNRIDETVNTFSASTVDEVNRIDETVSAFSAATVAEVNRIDEIVSTFSAATVAEVNRIDETVNAFSAATVAEVNRIDETVEQEKNERYANDLTPGTYVLDGNYSSEMVIPTNSTELPDVKIKVSDDFFNFGEF